MGRTKVDYLCNVCKCTLTDKSNFKRHLTSYKHKYNLKESGLEEDKLIVEIKKEQNNDNYSNKEGLAEYIKFMNSLTSS